MATSLIESSFTYRTESGGQAYYFTVVTNQNGAQGVREVLSPTGPVTGFTQVPQFVVDAQQTAMGQITGLLQSTSQVNGQATFLAQTERHIALPYVLSTTNYRVLLSLQSPALFWVTGQTTQGFTIQASTAFTGSVGYDVFL